MTRYMLTTTAAALALTAGTALASDEEVDGKTLNRQNPQPTDHAVEGATDYDGALVDQAAELQNDETLNRRDPQAVDPVFNLDDADMETIATFQAVEGKNGSEVVLIDGTRLGTLTEMDIDNAGRGEMTIDISGTQAVSGDSLVITTGPENVMMNDGMLVIAENIETISNLAGGDSGAGDGRPNVYLN